MGKGRKKRGIREEEIRKVIKTKWGRGRDSEGSEGRRGDGVDRKQLCTGVGI